MKWMTERGRVAAIVMAAALAGCEKPQLRTELSDTSSGEESTGATDLSGWKAQRARVIGRTFETLTLGSRRFQAARVRDITDRAIVVEHAGGVDEVAWSDVPENVREEWGYRVTPRNLADRLSGLVPGKDDAPAEEPPSTTTAPPPPGAGDTAQGKTASAPAPDLSPRERSEEIAKRQRRLDAQLAGLRTLESDFARHSQELAALRQQLRTARARRAGQRSGGVRVERVDGEALLVDRAREAREVQAQVRAKEEFVAQLSQALQAARKKYGDMVMAFEEFRDQ